MIKAKYRIVANRDNPLYYYCDNLKECIDRNNFIKETRKKLEKKKLENITLKNVKVCD